MKLSKKYGYLLMFIGIIILINGCKTSHKTTSIALSKMSKEERIESINSQSIQFNTLSSSLRFSFKPGIKKSTTTANAQLRIIKDEVIQLSLRVPIIGTEVARLSITPEQIIILDRTNRRYFSESMQVFRQMDSFDFDFYSLQALLTNKLFIAGKSTVSTENYKFFNWREDEFFTKLNNIDNQGINYDFISDFTNRIIQAEMYKNKKEINLNWLYKDFGLASNNRLFPMKMSIELTVPDDFITLNLTFNNLNINNNFTIETSIPNSYQRIGIEQIIILIQSL